MSTLRTRLPFSRSRSASSLAPHHVRRASITRRVGVAMAVVIGVLILDLASTVWGIIQLGDVNRSIQEQDLPLQSDSDALLVALVDQETGVRGYLLTHDPTFQAPLAQGQASYSTLVPDIRRLAGSRPAVSANLATLVSRVNTFETTYVQPALATAATQSPVQFAAAAQKGKALFDQARAAQATLETSIDRATQSDFSEAAAVRTRVLGEVIARAALGIGLGVVLLLLALRAVLRPIANLREVARALNEGRSINARSSAAPPELAEVHDTIVAAGSALQEREAALAQANVELEEASRLKSEFLATMSHELRTPLNAILGFTELVRSGATGSIDIQTDDYLERVHRNGAILLDLINDILDLSKIEAGRAVVNHEVVRVAPIVREVVRSVQAMADAKGITLEVLADDDDALAIADRRGVKQVVTNLLSNAVKFTAVGCVSVVVRASSDTTSVEVTDTGPGIAPDDREAIFEPFRQVGAHARTGTGGTGLGLPISVRLARLMGGDIRLTSEPERGSRFTLRLPAVRGYAGRKRDADIPVILGVDDDLDALSLWEAQCERLGFSFVGVQQSGAALTAAATLQPAAILLDIIFPTASGWDILDRLRNDERTAHIPVHVISVTDGEERAAGAGVRFLQKPVSEDVLRAELVPYQRVPAEAVA